jgi:hypothetical protein
MHKLHFRQHTSGFGRIYSPHVGGKKTDRKEAIFLLFICGFPLEHPIQRVGRWVAPYNIVASERLGLGHSY